MNLLLSLMYVLDWVCARVNNSNLKKYRMLKFKEISKDVFLTDAQRDEIASARRELTKALDDIVAAIESNREQQSNARDLKNKGQLSIIWGSVSGANDRDLAKMIKALGGSLENTQKAVQVVLRLQSRKDHVLREFHSVLVDKIHKIQGDTHILDANQQSAVDVLCEFQEQIEDQLRHHESVERHEVRIAELTAELKRKENELQEGLQSLGDQAANLKVAADHLAIEVGTVKRDLDARTAFNGQELKLLSESQKVLEESLDSLKVKGAQDFSVLQRGGQGLVELVDSLKKQNASTADVLTKRLEYLSQAEVGLNLRIQSLEIHLVKQASLTSWMKRNVVSVLALIFAGVAIAQTVLI